MHWFLLSFGCVFAHFLKKYFVTEFHQKKKYARTVTQKIIGTVDRIRILRQFSEEGKIQFLF